VISLGLPVVLGASGPLVNGEATLAEWFANCTYDLQRG
jgi:hypothetical protein